VRGGRVGSIASVIGVRWSSTTVVAKARWYVSRSCSIAAFSGDKPLIGVAVMSVWATTPTVISKATASVVGGNPTEGVVLTTMIVGLTGTGDETAVAVLGSGVVVGTPVVPQAVSRPSMSRLTLMSIKRRVRAAWVC